MFVSEGLLPPKIMRHKETKMNYQKIYNQLINKRRTNTINSGYYETHHIIPKSLGGSNDKNNLIKLTAKEHFICHLLLAKIYGGTMWYAAHMMSIGSNNRNSRFYRINSNTYETIRKQISITTRNRLLKNPIKNNYTEEFRKKLSKASLKKWQNKDFIKTIKDSRKITHSKEEFKENQRVKAIEAIDKMDKKEFREKYIKSRPFRKPIICVFKNKETMFLSLREASRELNIERKTIMSSIENNRELTKGNFIGYRFLYGS